MLQTLILIITVLLVHTVKAMRLYLALCDTDIKSQNYIPAYCMSTSVSIILPYKLGDLFRMYCFGRQVSNMATGVITVLFDRVMDTLGLITVIIISTLFSGEKISSITYILMIFIVLTLLAYYLFPGLYSFWKKFLLCAKATPRKNRTLKLITACDEVYCKIVKVARGRGIILYFMSVLCWAIEIGELAILIEVMGSQADGADISNYLDAAIGIGNSAWMHQFVIVGIGMLLTGFIFASMINVIRGKGEESCK